MEYQPKLNERYTPFLHCISKIFQKYRKYHTSYAVLIRRFSHQFLYFLFFISFYTADISFFHNFLELHSALFEKTFSPQIFFLTDSFKPFHPLNDNLTGKMLSIEHFSSKASSNICVLSYSEPSLIDINGATSELANPGISSGLNFNRSRS